MTNPSPGLSQPVRRVSPTSPNSAAITSSMLPIPMRRVIPDRRSGNEFPQLPQPMRRVPRLPRTVRRVIHRIATSSAASPPRPPRRERASLAFPNCPTNAASRPPTAKQCGELLRLSRTVQTNAASRPPTAKQCGELLRLSRTVQPMRRVIPPGLPHPVRRVPSCTPEQWARIFCFPEFCGELCSEQKQLTALTIGNEGIQIQWPSRAHTRKHEAALPPVLMFFL